MATALLETGHTGPVSDVAVDASGKRLATSSFDGTVRLYELETNSITNSSSHNVTHGEGSNNATWRLFHTLDCGVEEGVQCIAWAPLAYYNSGIAVCTKNNEVSLWSDIGNSKQYEKVYRSPLRASGLCIAWAPQEYGKLFSVGCADGTVVVFTGHDNNWEVQSFDAHHGDCCSLSWAPFFPSGSLLMAPLESEVVKGGVPIPIAPPRLVTCGSSGNVKIWTHSFQVATEDGAPPSSLWTPMDLRSEVDGSWRCVAWAPNVGLPFTYIAAGSEEGNVVIWLQDGAASERWRCVVLPTQSDCVSKLSWSEAGTYLLVSCVDGTACMWKETVSKEWERVSELVNPMAP